MAFGAIGWIPALLVLGLVAWAFGPWALGIPLLIGVSWPFWQGLMRGSQ